MAVMKGDLVLVRGRMAIVMRDPYTYRFMEAEDHEMVEHGMGEYAGLYGTAVDVMFPESGMKRRVKRSEVSVLDGGTV